VFFKNNLDIVNGSHKIMEFSNEIEKYNKECEDFYKKFAKLTLKNEDFSKSLSFLEKNISFIKTPSPNKINNVFDYSNKVKPIEILDNKRKISSKLLSHLPIRLLNEYNRGISENNTINNSNNVYSTDFNGMNYNNINTII
jgi:hypothetical protein